MLACLGCPQSIGAQGMPNMSMQEKILNGVPYTDEEWNQYLNTVHSQTSGVTVPFATFPTDLGPDTYQVILDEIPATAKQIWEVGCGDAHLIEMVWNRFKEKAKIGGSDLVASEIEVAKKRLGHTGMKLLAEPIQHMSNGTASSDVVLAHLVLMLVLPLDPAEREIHRILAPNGTLLSVVTRPDAPDSLMNQVFDFMENFIRKHYPKFSTIRSGDRRMLSTDGIKGIFSDDKGYKDLKFKDYSMLMEDTPEQIWERFFATTHTFLVLPERLRGQLRTEALQWMQLRATNGRIKMDQPLRLFSVRRK